MKILHLGNIAQNGYLNAKFQRQVGLEADALIYDYKHIMGQPEWEDADIDEGVRVDEFNPDWSSIDLHGFKRPDWFRAINHDQGGMISIKGTLKDIKNKKLRMGPRMAGTLKQILIQRALQPKNFLKLSWYTLNCIFIKFKVEQEYKKYVDPADILPSSPYIEQYIKQSDSWIKKYFKNLSYLVGTYWLSQEFRPIFDKYDFVQAYGIDPILVYLSGTKTPLISFEHGTMRTFPFENFIIGKLLTVAYFRSKAVIVTNQDCIDSAKKLKLKNYICIPHPIDDGKFKPYDLPLKEKLRKEHGADFVVFHPTRHNWEIKGNDKLISSFARFIKNDNQKAILICSDWGQDQEKSRGLIDELGISSNVIWVAPLSKRRLADYYNASDVVADQFIIHAFGTTSPEAMACGKPVVTCMPVHAEEFFGQIPPILAVDKDGDIYDGLKKLWSDAEFRKKIGKQSYDWFQNCHGSEFVNKKTIGLYKNI